MASGLAQLLDSLGGLDSLDELADALPLTNLAPLGPGGLNTDGVWTAIKAALTGVGDKTAANVQSALNGLNGTNVGGGITLTINTSVSPDGITFNKLALARTVDTPLAFLSGDANDPATFNLDGGTLSAALNLTLADSDTAVGALVVERAGTSVQIPASGISNGTFGATISLSGDISARLGMLDVTASGTASASLNGSVKLRDPDGSGAITQFELVNSSAADLIDINLTGGTAAMNLTLSADLNGLAGVTGTIVLNDTNVLDGLDTPTVNLNNLIDFTRMTPQDVLAAIAQLAIGLRALQINLGNPNIPFVDENLAELASWSDRIQKFFLDNGLAPDANNPLDFQVDAADLATKGLTTIEGILDKFAKTILNDLTKTAADLGLNYHAASSSVLFEIDIANAGLGSPPGATINVADELAKLGITSLQVSGGTSITVTPTYSLKLTVGLDLSDMGLAAPVTNRVFLQPAAGNEFEFDAPVSADLNLTGRIGLLQLSLADTAPEEAPSLGKVPLLGRRATDLSSPMFKIDLSTTAPNGRITLAQLFDSLSSVGVTAAGNQVTVTTPAFTIAGALNVGVPETTLAASASVGSTPLASATVTFSWPDLTAPGGLQVSADDSFNDNFLSFNLDSSDPLALFSTILQGIDAALQIFEDLSGEDVDRRIPVLDLSLTDLTGFIDNVQDAINALAGDPAGTLQLLELAVEAAILQGLDQLDGAIDHALPPLPQPQDFGSGNAFNFDAYRAALEGYLAQLQSALSGFNFVDLEYVPGNSPGALLFKLNLGVCSDKAAYSGQGCTFEYELKQDFNLSLADVVNNPAISGIVGAEASGTLDLDYNVSARVHLGVELPTVTPAGPGQLLPTVSGLPKLFLAGTSGISASVDGEIVGEFGATIGPFGVQIGETTAEAETGADCDNNTDDDGDGVVNDGCPAEGDPEEGDACLNDTDDDDPLDGKINDGCPAVANPAVARAGAAFELAVPDTTTRYYVLPSDGPKDLSDFFTDITPSINKVTEVDCAGDSTPGVADFVCARLPVYVTAPAKVFLGNLVLTVPNFDFSGTTFTGGQEVLDALLAAGPDLLWALIGQGIKKFGEAVEESVTAAAYDIQVPIIGDVLDAGANIATEFKNRVTDPIGTFMEGFASNDEFEEIRDALRDFFWDALNGGAANAADRFLLNFDSPGDAPVKAEDIIVRVRCVNATTECNDTDHTMLDLYGVEVEVAIGQGAKATTPAFDWGVPGLRLQGDDATLTGEVSWQVNLGFGLSIGDGFYLISNTAVGAGKPDIGVNAGVRFGTKTTSANLTNATKALSGDLAFLSATLWNTKPAEDPDQEVFLNFGINLPNGNAGKIGLAQFPSLLNPSEWDVTVSGGIDLQLTLATTANIEGGASEGAIPRLLADLNLAWNVDGNIKTGFSSSGLTAGFANVRLDLGSLVREFLDPILGEVQKFTKPLQPIIDTLQAPIPGVSQLAELVGADPITLIDLMEAVSGADLTMIRRLLDVISFANSIPTLAVGQESLIIPLGNFGLDPAALTKPELPANVKDKLIQAPAVDPAAANGGVFSQLASKSGSSTFNQNVEKARGSTGGFSFPAFEDPTQLFQLLVGKDVSLVEFDAGTLKAGVSWSQSFGPITIGPIPVSIVVSISASVEGRFVIGYDTKGIRQLVKAVSDGDPGFFDGLAMLFAGVYLSDLDKDGKDVPEIRLVLEGAVGAAVDLVIVKAGVEAGLRATLDMNLHDGGFADPPPPENLDGKLRIDEIITFINNPICLFDMSGKLEAFIRVFVTIDLFLFSATFKQTIVNIVLLELDDILRELCKPPPPVLASPVGSDGVLRLNMGAFANVRNYAPDEKDEKFTVRQISPANSEGKASVSVSAFGILQEYHNVSKVIGGGADGKDTILAEPGSVAGNCQADGTIAPPLFSITTCDPATQLDKIVNEVITFTLPVAFCGGPGADKLGGGEGNDELMGNGTLTSASATSCTNTGDGAEEEDDEDKIDGNGGHDTIWGNGAADVLNGGSGNDTIHGGAGHDEIIGGPGKDILNGNAGNDNMLGGPEADPCPGSDTDLCSDAADDIMDGGSGNDTMEGDHGKDTMNGGSGNDIMVGGFGNDTMNGGADHDTMFGNQGDDTMNGGSGDDDMRGGTGNDTINGDGGHDDLVGEEGVDTINGGAGQDLILGDRGIINRAPGGGFSPFPADKPLIELIATPDNLAGGDFLHGDGDDDRIWGQEGDDTITGGAGNDILRGNAGNDTMSGNAGADEMYGDAGDDTMYGDALGGGAGAGDLADVMHGGAGNDTMSGNAAGDTMYGNSGEDTMYGDADAEVCALDGNDTMFGGPDDDLMFGNSGDDTMFGEGGHDRMVGGSNTSGVCDGVDTMSGGEGNDVMTGDNATIGAGATANDRLVSLHLDSQGTGDIIFGDNGNDRIYGQFGNDVISGGNGADMIEGNEGNDEIYGDAGNDDLVGGSSAADGVNDADRVGDGRPDGDDEIHGGTGLDWITGDNALINRSFPAAGRAPIHLFDVGIVSQPPINANFYGDDDIFGGDGIDQIFGQAGDDTIYGGAGDDYIEGNDGDDTIYGEDGDDDLVGGGSANDGRIIANRVGNGLRDVGESVVDGGPGEDWMTGDNALIDRNVPSNSSAPIILFDVETTAVGPLAGTGGADNMWGRAGTDWMFGQTGGDFMYGGDDDDYIEGNNGDDTIYGEDGDDDLVGGGSANDGVIDGDRVGNGLLDVGESLISGGNGVDWITGDNALVNRNRPVAPSFGRAPIELFDVQTAAGPVISPLVSGGDLLMGDAGNDRIYGQGNGHQPLTQTDPADGRNNDFVGSAEGSDDFFRVGGPAAGVDEDAAGWLGDIILGGLGDDEIEGNHGNDLIFGNGDNESGADQDDILGGGSADDGKIWPNARLNNGANLLDGHDTIHGDNGEADEGDHDVILGDNGWIQRPGGSQSGDGPGPASATELGDVDDPSDDVIHMELVNRLVLMTTTITPAGTYGNDYLAGNGGHDEIYGQAGHDAILGEWGSDALVGDLGKVTTDLLGNGDDTLCGTPRFLEPKEPFVGEWVCQPRTLFRRVELYGFADTSPGAVIGNDVMLGGDGDDWMHGGAGQDLMQGDGDGGGEIEDPNATYTTTVEDPNPGTADADRIFGGDSNGRGTVDPVLGGDGDAIWGGRGNDYLFGGNGDDMIDVRPDGVYSATWEAWAAADVESYHGQDVAYGGWDQDAMQANMAANGPVAGDRMLDWAGVYNITYLCPATYGAYVSVRGQSPGFIDWVLELAIASGALNPKTAGTSGYNEVAMVYKPDVKDNTNPIYPGTPGHFACSP